MYASDPRFTIYFFSWQTSSGIVHSKIDAWKYHKYFPVEPEAFARRYVHDKLFRRFGGIVAVDVVAVELYDVTRVLIDFFARADMAARESPLIDRIVGRYRITREDFADNDP